MLDQPFGANFLKYLLNILRQAVPCFHIHHNIHGSSVGDAVTLSSILDHFPLLPPL